MDDIPKIGITGMPSVGKTNTLKKIIEKIEASGYKIEGMITEPIIEKKKRVGFFVKDWQTKEKEVFAVMDDLVQAKCDILVLGQYLAPSLKHYPVKEYVSIEKFQSYRKRALNLEFKQVLAHPLARTSYKARDLYSKIRDREFINA